MQKGDSVSELTPQIQPWILSVEQSGNNAVITLTQTRYVYSLWYDPSGDQTHNMPVSGQTLLAGDKSDTFKI